MREISPGLRWNLLVTDVGFLVYWAITAVGVLPTEWLFKDYSNPILVAWNWSFAPIDLCASGFGLASLVAARNGKYVWRSYALISVTLTFCAGAMALGFWMLRHDFDPWWWAPNFYLLAWPLFFVSQLVNHRRD